ncbi:MAG: hypothetical protein A2X61_14735 [Ignavibacteria bacterium GWB2_35_12]|nr:MAG: hypothetical protein A2X63_06665 [Ignavibacteria bacterium GWA2_35_8]OGU38337.1 MAG: hypothetical protein A2X61_14735 [Ignavibacteria bacterium GWB2_35_12]OGU90696.1 MAG: hypothetical protein A2220_08695 [Ignavibacteria bacterium RIFOXYA2_FULL_35_10]OGV23427.1 MAG: hypothetical protein A2475_06520 [Ignavibacteria bacterium RIFOXYC2_FULL_35_21]
MDKFEWDINKDKNNLVKHSVSFDEAKTVFFDIYAFIFNDKKHSLNEIRKLIIGYSNINRLLIVSFTLRNNKIRIISSRLANKKERRKHEEFIKKRIHEQ